MIVTSRQLESFPRLLTADRTDAGRLVRKRGRPLQKVPFCPISVSGSNFNPLNTHCISVVNIFAFLELEQKLTFFKGLSGE